MDGVQKSAILLLTLGENEAANVLKHLEPKEVQKIGAAMAQIKGLSASQMSDVLLDFHRVASQKTSIGLDSGVYVRNVLNKALGEEKAAGVIDRIHGAASDTSGIESLKWMDAPSIAELIGGEHPQIIATILVHLEPDLSADVLSCFNDRQRNDVMQRIATLDGVLPTALEELNDVLTKLLAAAGTMKKRVTGGGKKAADILGFLASAQSDGAIEAIRGHNQDLAQQITDQMFSFEKLLDADDHGIQQLIRDIGSEILIVAMKTASSEMKEKIFKNMSQRAAEMLREDLEAKGQVKRSDVESAQREIMRRARELMDEGKLIVGSAEDVYV